MTGPRWCSPRRKFPSLANPCQPASVKGSAVYICSVPAGTYSIDIEQPGYTPTQVMFALEAEGMAVCLCGPIAYGSASIVRLTM